MRFQQHVSIELSPKCEDGCPPPLTMDQAQIQEVNMDYDLSTVLDVVGAAAGGTPTHTTRSAFRFVDYDFWRRAFNRLLFLPAFPFTILLLTCVLSNESKRLLNNHSGSQQSDT